MFLVVQIKYRNFQRSESLILTLHKILSVVLQFRSEFDELFAGSRLINPIINPILERLTPVRTRTIESLSTLVNCPEKREIII